MGNLGDCLIYADYAHHPEQVKNTVKMLDLKYDNYAVFFQSHTFSRTANLFKDFVAGLSSVKNLFVFDTFGAREKYNYSGSAKRLCEELKGCVYCGSIKNAEAILKSVSSRFECIAILGAGDLYDEVEWVLKNEKVTL
jgi:UDP-N-acetylmuramate--alanine ligase